MSLGLTALKWLHLMIQQLGQICQQLRMQAEREEIPQSNIRRNFKEISCSEKMLW